MRFQERVIFMKELMNKKAKKRAVMTNTINKKTSNTKEVNR